MRGGGGGGYSEVHGHLHCCEHFKLQVVETAQDGKLFNLLSVSRLIIALKEADKCGVICKLHLDELYSNIFRCAVIGEVHGHLHCCEHFKLQVVETAQDGKLFNLLSVSRLIIALKEADKCGVICKLHLDELYSNIFRCAVIGVQGEEQWGENAALRSSSADYAGAG